MKKAMNESKSRYSIPSNSSSKRRSSKSKLNKGKISTKDLIQRLDDLDKEDHYLLGKTDNLLQMTQALHNAHVSSPESFSSPSSSSTPTASRSASSPPAWTCTLSNGSYVTEAVSNVTM